MEEFFVVAVRRSDGAIPKLSKAADEQFFLDRKEAEEGAARLNLKLNMTGWSVFRCEGRILDEVKE